MSNIKERSIHIKLEGMMANIDCGQGVPRYLFFLSTQVCVYSSVSQLRPGHETVGAQGETRHLKSRCRPGKEKSKYPCEVQWRYLGSQGAADLASTCKNRTATSTLVSLPTLAAASNEPARTLAHHSSSTNPTRFTAWKNVLFCFLLLHNVQKRCQ